MRTFLQLFIRWIHFIPETFYEAGKRSQEDQEENPYLYYETREAALSACSKELTYSFCSLFGHVDRTKNATNSIAQHRRSLATFFVKEGGLKNLEKALAFSKYFSSYALHPC